MPVFHTKVIESILEPVAQQVKLLSLILVHNCCAFVHLKAFDHH